MKKGRGKNPPPKDEEDSSSDESSSSSDSSSSSSSNDGNGDNNSDVRSGTASLSKTNKKNSVDHEDGDKKSRKRGVGEDEETSKRLKHNDSEDEDEAATKKPEGEKANFYSKASDTFSSLPLSEQTQFALKELSFTRMTEIQSMSIPPLLAGKDLIGAAKTGSGKVSGNLIGYCSSNSNCDLYL